MDLALQCLSLISHVLFLNECGPPMDCLDLIHVTLPNHQKDVSSSMGGVFSFCTRRLPQGDLVMLLSRMFPQANLAMLLVPAVLSLPKSSNDDHMDSVSSSPTSQAPHLQSSLITSAFLESQPTSYFDSPESLPP